MTLTYTEIPVCKHDKPNYEITVVFEHGDADTESTDSLILFDINETELLEIIEGIRYIQTSIYDNKYYSTPLPEDVGIETTIKYGDKSFVFGIQYDMLFGSDEFAAITSFEIHYFNDGKKFKVSGY